MSFEFSNFFQNILNAVKASSEYGLPIPLILIAVVFFLLKRDQIRWHSREKYYGIILENLDLWQRSLSDRLDYYQQSGSEYNDECMEKDHFILLQKEGSLAQKNIRKSLGFARVFLSDISVSVLEKLESEHWNISEHGALCMADYLALTLAEVDKAYEHVLKDAKQDFKKYKFSKAWGKKDI